MFLLFRTRALGGQVLEEKKGWESTSLDGEFPGDTVE